MKNDIKLLKKMAGESRTLFPVKNFYNLGASIANPEDLIKSGYINIHPIIEKDKKVEYYEITTKGHLLLKDIRDKKWQMSGVIMTGIVLLLSLTGLVLQFVK